MVNKVKIAKAIADLICAKINEDKESVKDGEAEIAQGELTITAYYNADVDVSEWTEVWDDPYCSLSFSELNSYEVNIKKVEVYDWDTDKTIEDEELKQMIISEFGQ